MERERPLISVIVPVYNVEDYLERCLDSLLMQTYPRIEIILVDDASQDKSAALCDGYAARNKQVQAVHFPKNRGPSAARNQGILQAQGEYISFVDADDQVEKELLEKLYESMTETGAQISACGADGIELKQGPAAVYGQREAVCCLARGFPFNLVPWGKLYCARLVKENLSREDIFYSEDLLFLYSVLKQVSRVSYRPDILYHYTRREGSQMHSGASERKLTAFMAQDFVCREAEMYFPEAAEDFHLLALEANRCLAVLTVKEGGEDVRTLAYLKRIQENTRQHFSFRSLARIPRMRDGAALLALCASPRGFWAAAAAFTWVKGLGGCLRWKRKDRKSV